MFKVTQHFAVILHAEMKDASFYVGIRVTRVELDRLVYVRKSQIESIAALP